MWQDHGWPRMKRGGWEGQLMAVSVQDFAFESNEQRMRAAAHLMASSLAGAYAMNQCREPMRGSLLSQLHTLLKPPSLDPAVSHTSRPHDLSVTPQSISTYAVQAHQGRP